MSESNVYSFKVDKGQLERAKKFFARQGIPLQDNLRDLIDVAADCEQCLELHEDDAPIGELQSAFTTLLANSKNTWHLNSVLQESVLKLAKITKMPVDVIVNILGEARRIKTDTVKLSQ